jgi:hypothetical protein
MRYEMGDDVMCEMCYDDGGERMMMRHKTRKHYGTVKVDVRQNYEMRKQYNVVRV